MSRNAELKLAEILENELNNGTWDSEDFDDEPTNDEIRYTLRTVIELLRA